MVGLIFLSFFCMTKKANIGRLSKLLALSVLVGFEMFMSYAQNGAKLKVEF